jgi:phosphatidylserine decarboxylase
MSHSLRSLVQYLLPQHSISRLVHRATRWPRMPLRRPLTRWFVRRFKVDMREAVEPDPLAYPDFNSFFTRALRPEARPLPDDPQAICSPVDGFVSESGTIRDDEIFQAKGHTYSLDQLLGGSAERARPFRNGAFATLYLSPADYHRVHMPQGGQLREMVHVPGRLFSVSPACVDGIQGLFARNERVIGLFDTEVGPMALVLVGAINVGSIETVWAGEVTPPRGRRLTTVNYPTEGGHSVALARGAEMGRFNLGSTVIVLFGADRVRWEKTLSPGAKLRMGQVIGRRVGV